MAGLLAGRCLSFMVPFRALGGGRITRSAFSLSHVFHSIRNAAPRLCRAFHVQNSIFLALQIVIVHKKFFQLLHELLAELFDMADMGITVIRFLDGNDSVVALAFLLVSLLTLDDSDDAALSRQPAKAGSSISTSTSVGSPSSALVDGIKPNMSKQHWGRVYDATNAHSLPLFP